MCTTLSLKGFKFFTIFYRLLSLYIYIYISNLPSVEEVDSFQKSCTILSFEIGREPDARQTKKRLIAASQGIVNCRLFESRPVRFRAKCRSFGIPTFAFRSNEPNAASNRPKRPGIEGRCESRGCKRGRNDAIVTRYRTHRCSLHVHCTFYEIFINN